jgi:hypothetical protein
MTITATPPDESLHFVGSSVDRFCQNDSVHMSDVGGLIHVRSD